VREANPFEAYGDAASGRRIVGKLLKFSKGDYLAGQDGEDVALGKRFVAVMSQLATGWIKWENNAPAEHVMGLVVDGYVPPKRDTLGDTDEDAWDTDDRGEPRDPWQLSNYLILINPDDVGDQYTLATSSRGGIGAIGELCKAYGRHMREAPDEYPVIALGVGSYQHRDKQFGRIKFPILEVVGWVERAAFDAALETGGSDAGSAPAAAPDNPVIAHQKQEMAAKAARRGVNLEDTF
jgi:hypothetical protein